MSVLASELGGGEQLDGPSDARELHLVAASEIEREGWIMMLHRASKVIQKADCAKELQPHPSAQPRPKLSPPRAQEPLARWIWSPA